MEITVGEIAEILEAAKKELEQSEDYKAARKAWQDRRDNVAFPVRDMMACSLANESGYYMGLAMGFLYASNTLMKRLGRP